jgi:hypothetical protein
MNANADFDQSEYALDDLPEEIVASSSDPIGVTFASNVHESDLFSFVERAKYLTGEMD